ncbi:hypothetical protein [Serratia fonticola]|uniref:DUF4760 domain-containing protein n=1 Tax=Serratia fonticola TaxID=47917 RepID=A0ABY9PV88_SERFO|nr:hypothetical protein [Serratia fonticola]WMT16036.1 hypothetical protein RFB13_06825 [Serratia fonticola]
MDSILAGALIGGSFAIAGSIVTAVATFRINKANDKIKLITSKKEELYTACERLKSNIFKNYHFVSNAIHGVTTTGNEGIKDNLHSSAHVKLLVALYFQELKDDLAKIETCKDSFGTYYLHVLDIPMNMRTVQNISKQFVLEAREKYLETVEAIQALQDKLTTSQD